MQQGPGGKRKLTDFHLVRRPSLAFISTEPALV